MSEPSSSTPAKRGPGRPSQKTACSELTRGIVDTPVSGHNKIEFSYHDISVWKGLFNMLKGFKAKDIFIRFRQTDICIFTRDHLRNGIFARLDCSNAAHYYCDKSISELTLCIYRDNVDNLFSTPTRTTDKVLLQYEDGIEDHISIKFFENTLSKIKERPVPVHKMDVDADLLHLETCLDEYINNTKIYVAFTLPTKNFKEMIADANSQTDKIFIEKQDEESPLEFKYDSTHMVPYSDHYADGTKIALVQNLQDTTFFRCTLNTSPLKALSSSSVLKHIRLYCGENNVVCVNTTVGNLFNFVIMTDNNR